MLWKKEPDQYDSFDDVLYVNIFDNIGELNKRYASEMNQIKGSINRNTDLADSLRVQGNRWFTDKLYERAMEKYNASLSYAEKGSEQMAKAYGNRSACFFYMNMFEKCLIDIKFAEKAKCCVGLKTKLGKRKADCLRLIEENADDVTLFTIPKLSFEKNEKIPCMANVLDIQYSTEFGFYLVAKCDIDVGKTILVEQFYSSVLVADKSRCSVCGKEESMNLVPCDTCSDTMFCSKECTDHSFHNLECEGNIFYKGESAPGAAIRKTMFQFTVRTIVKAFYSFSNVSEFITFVERCIGKERNLVPISLEDEIGKYEAFLKVLPDKDYVHKHHCVEDVFFIFKFLLKSDLGKFFATYAQQQFLVHLIWHHLSIGLLYCDSRWKHLEQLDSTLTVILSFMNFSCTPNAVICSVNGSKVLTSVRPIEKGEQILISRTGDHLTVYYQPMHFDEPLSVINRNQCNCDRCEKRSSSPSERHAMGEDPHYQFILQNYSKERYVESKSERLKQNAIEFLRKFGRSIWCPEIALAVDCLDTSISFQCRKGKK